MNIMEAQKTGQPVRRRGKEIWILRNGNVLAKTFDNGYIDFQYLLTALVLTTEDFQADDWEVQEERFTVTESDIKFAIKESLEMLFALERLDVRALEAFCNRVIEMLKGLAR